MGGVAAYDPDRQSWADAHGFRASAADDLSQANPLRVRGSTATPRFVSSRGFRLPSGSGRGEHLDGSNHDVLFALRQFASAGTTRTLLRLAHLSGEHGSVHRVRGLAVARLIDRDRLRMATGGPRSMGKIKHSLVAAASDGRTGDTGRPCTRRPTPPQRQPPATTATNAARTRRLSRG